MALEMELLVWAVVLTLVQSVIAVCGAMLQVGPARLSGNREAMPPIEGWAGRADRAHRNMLQSLVLFTALVLVAQIAGRTGGMTALGAQLFFWARVVYVPIYLIGIPWARTGVWAVSVVGLVMILMQLL